MPIGKATRIVIRMMYSEPMIAVLMPAYNGSLDCGEVIKSLFSQLTQTMLTVAGSIPCCTAISVASTVISSG